MHLFYYETCSGPASRLSLGQLSEGFMTGHGPSNCDDQIAQLLLSAHFLLKIYGIAVVNTISQSDDKLSSALIPEPAAQAPALY